MPVQRTLFGRPIPHIPPRRIAQLLGSIAVFALLTLIFALPSSIPGPSLSKFSNGHRISIPKIPKFSPSILNPLRPAAHPPPEQLNSTSGDTKWRSGWNWLSPFSSSVTLDENRSLLPPLRNRPAIYTYYDHTLKKDAEITSAEKDFLITWRRAWWAQGFRPMILGPADAMKNPLYDQVQKMQLESDIQFAIARWLAWENMGTGILCDYLALPMGPYEDTLLSYLRRGEFPLLTRYKGLGSGLFSGDKAGITSVLKAALAAKDIRKSKNVIEAVPKETFTVDPVPDSIAFYSPATVKAKYPKVDEGPKGLKLLHQLVNAHLHNTWQNHFSDGIAVLKPLPTHMTAAVEPATQLATFLAQCPESPIPGSCPPNRPKCKTCVASVPLKISTPAQYRNASSVYTIGTVPHPYTLLSLNALTSEVTVPYIRRETSRDSWVTIITKELLGTGVSTAPRVVKFKEAVASPYASAHSIWVIAEKPLPGDLGWYFGFQVPKTFTDTAKSETPKTDDKEIVQERQLLEKAGNVVGEGKKGGMGVVGKGIREAAEAWNLADSEAWRFARAWLARSRVERIKWEEEEKKYAGGAGAEAAVREGWGRWFD